MSLIIKTSIADFKAWGTGADTKNTIIANGKTAEFDTLIEKTYSEALTAEELNDLLCIDSDWVFEALGIVA